jgi:KDO2-lipid IV(A) lauroyltransferase
MTSKKTSIASPRYWPTWLGVLLLWSIAKFLPYATAVWLGRKMGRLGYRLADRRRHIAEVNLALCYPDMTDEQRDRLTLRHFESLGMGLLTTGFAWWARDKKLRPLVTIEGLDHLKSSMQRGKGVILLSGHFTDLEMTARLLSLYHPFAAMYRRHENPVIERAFSRNRDLRSTAAIPRDDIRLLLRTLKKEQQAVWYAPDQSFSEPNSALVPFFGVPASTHTGTARLAKITGAAVHLFIGFRLPGSQGYRLLIEPALHDFPSDSPEQDAARVNGLIEKAVGYAPEQYLWIHRRFKNRRGLADPY